MRELSTKPYLIRAIYEWCSDSDHTPYISVRVDAQTRVPEEYVRDGEIIRTWVLSPTRRKTPGAKSTSAFPLVVESVSSAFRKVAFNIALESAFPLSETSPSM